MCSKVTRISLSPPVSIREGCAGLLFFCKRPPPPFALLVLLLPFPSFPSPPVLAFHCRRLETQPVPPRPPSLPPSRPPSSPQPLSPAPRQGQTEAGVEHAAREEGGGEGGKEGIPTGKEEACGELADALGEVADVRQQGCTPIAAFFVGTGGGGREGGREGREGGKEGRKEGGRDGIKEGGRRRGKEGGREGEKEGGKEGRRREREKKLERLDVQGNRASDTDLRAPSSSPSSPPSFRLFSAFHSSCVRKYASSTATPAPWARMGST